MKKDKSKYFGPFTSAAAVKDTIELLNKLFKLRTCNRVLPRDCGLERPCLNYHIGQCMAPCQDYVSREEYRAHVDKALEFLNGNYNMILNDLQKKMEILPSALSRLLRGMEEKGLCVRRIDPKDRRSSYVSLTETGQERRDQGHGIMEVFAQRVVERMGEGRFRELIKQWERFGDVLETEIAAFRNVDGMEE